MLTHVHQTLLAHLAGLDAPVFHENCVPQGQGFPYITLAASLPGISAQSGTLTLTCWCHGPSAHSHRLALADSILALIPSDGLRLDCPQGRIVLRGDGDIQCVRSGEALGIRMVWALQFFPRV